MDEKIREQANKLFIDEVIRGRIIDVGEVRIARSGLGRKKLGTRYVIYLPLNRNYIWRELHKTNRKFRVFIEVPFDVVEAKNNSGTEI
jgi:hypothetical protein